MKNECDRCCVFIARPPKDENMQTNDGKEILGSFYFENKAFFKS
jgi:hypothetical protein